MLAVSPVGEDAKHQHAGRADLFLDRCDVFAVRNDDFQTPVAGRTDDDFLDAAGIDASGHRRGQLVHLHQALADDVQLVPVASHRGPVDHDVLDVDGPHHQRAALDFQTRGFGFNSLAASGIGDGHFNVDLALDGRTDHHLVARAGTERLLDLHLGLFQAFAQPLLFVHLVDQPRTAFQIDRQLGRPHRSYNHRPG